MLSKMKNCSNCGSSWVGIDRITKASSGSGRVSKRSKNGRRYSTSIRTTDGQVCVCRNCQIKSPIMLDVVKAVDMWNKMN